MQSNNPNGARNFECCNNFSTNGEPFSRLTQPCRKTVNEIIKVIIIVMKNLSIKFYNWGVWREEALGEIYVQKFIEMSGTHIYDLMFGITPPLSSLSATDFGAIMEYMYQGCTQPYSRTHPVQYLRGVFFLENILADCYAHIHQTIFMEYLGFYQSNTHRQSNQQVCNSSPLAHRSASKQNVPFENHKQDQQTLAPPDYNAYQPVDPISQLEQMMPNLERTFAIQKQTPQRETFNYNSAAFNTESRSQLNSQREKLTPPIWPDVEDRDHSVPNQVPDLVNNNQMLDCDTPPAAVVIPYVESTPLPGIVLPPLNLVPSHVIQSPMRQYESNQLESEANSVAQLQTVLNSHQNRIISNRSHSERQHVSDSSDVNPTYVCEPIFAAAVDSIDESLLQPQPVIDLSHLNIPIANKLYYDMPVLESFSHDSLTEKTLPSEVENYVNNPRDSKQPKCLARDHFLVKKFLANRMRWPFTSLFELANTPRPVSLKNSKRSASGLTRISSTEVIEGARGSNQLANSD